MTLSPEAPALRVLIVDDSEMVRAGLRTLLGIERSLEIVGEASSVASAVDAAARLQPAIVLLDIRLPDGSGVEACRQILARSPGTRVLIVTSMIDHTVVAEAIRAGAHGYLLKEIDGRALVSAIHQVAAGQAVLDPAVTASVIQRVKATGPTQDPLAELSSQERRLLGLIAEGCTNKEAGAKLAIGEKTVRNLLSAIFEKLHVTRRAEAAALYAQSGRKT